MQRTCEQESYKVTTVSVAHACPDPWAVVVMHLHADPAVAAVECSGRPQYVARFAKGQLVVFVLLDHLGVNV